MGYDSSPLVSVVTPVYNGAKYIGECIRSVRSQTYQNWEHIILNNSSTDNTLEIAQKYAATDKRLRIHNTDTLLPIMDNWNFALKQISPESKYCKVVHADDLLFSNCLEKMVNVAESHPTAGLVGSYGLWGERIISKGLPETTEFLSGKELSRLTLLNKVNCFWSPSSLLIRSDLVRERPAYYDPGILHADVKSCYETLKKSDFAFVHQVLTFIRKHEDSVTSSAALPLNRFVLDNLDHLLNFGPVFLSPTEYREHLKIRTKQYYRFLARSVFQLRQKKFWDYHMNTLAKIGLGIRYSKLIYASLSLMILRPAEAFSLFARPIPRPSCRR